MKEIDGKNYRVKNSTLIAFNFIQNNFTEKSFDKIKSLLDGNNKLGISVDYKIYSEEQRNLFNDSNGQYYQRVYFSK